MNTELESQFWDEDDYLAWKKREWNQEVEE